MQAYEAVNAALKAVEQAHIAVDKAAAEVSLLESEFCEATEGHDWKPKEPDDVMTGPWEECSRCGCGRSFSAGEPAQPATPESEADPRNPNTPESKSVAHVPD